MGPEGIQPGTLGPKGESITTTARQLTPSLTSRGLSRLGTQSLIDNKRAQDEAIAAMQGEGPADRPPELADLSADMARSELADAALGASDEPADDKDPDITGTRALLESAGMLPDAGAVGEPDGQPEQQTPEDARAERADRGDFDQAGYQTMVEQAAQGQRPAQLAGAQMNSEERDAAARVRSEAAGPDDGKRYTTQDFARDKWMQEPRTQAAAQDEANEYAARAKARQDEAYRAEMQRIEQERQRQIVAAQQRVEMLAQQLRGQKITSLFSDMSTPKRILTAIAVGLGSAGGGPNYAAEILGKEMQLDFERKRVAAEQYMKEMERAGARPEMIMKFAHAAQEQALASHKAALDQIDANATKMLAPFPAAQNKMKADIAAARAKVAKDTQDAILAHTEEASHIEGVKETVAEGKSQSDRSFPSSKDVMERSDAHVDAEHVRNMLKSIEAGHWPTPAQMQVIRNNEAKLMASRAAETHSPINVAVNQFWRDVGALPDSVFPPDVDEETRENYNTHMSTGHNYMVDKFGQSSMSNPESYSHFAAVKLAQPTDTIKGALRKVRAIAEPILARDEELAKVSKTGEKERKYEAAAARREAGARSGLSEPEKRQLLADALKVKKGSPDYEEAQAYIKRFRQEAITPRKGGR